MPKERKPARQKPVKHERGFTVLAGQYGNNIAAPCGGCGMPTPFPQSAIGGGRSREKAIRCERCGWSNWLEAKGGEYILHTVEG